MNALTTQNTGTAVAMSADNPFATYGDAVTQRTIVGELLKFSKGEYLSGKDGDEVAEGTELVANMGELMVGWVKWEGGKPSEHVMGRIAESYVPPKRNTLGDDDQSLWETDETSGQPRDPWQMSNYLIMKDRNGEQLYTFTTSSRGGLNAVGDLCKKFGKDFRMRPDEWPVVSLEVDSYRHPNKAYGKIFVPVLKIVGWAPKAEFADALEAEAGDRKADEESRSLTAETASRGKAGGSMSQQPAPAGEATRF